MLEQGTQFEPVRRRHQTSSILSKVRSEARVVDLLLLLGLPGLLIAVFGLPLSVKHGYVLEYTNPTLITGFTAHFIHLDAGHLLTNLLAYSLIVPFVYGFCVLSHRRRQYYLAAGLFVIVFPLVLSGLNVALVRPRVGFGFSGIVMAVLGFLPISLVWYLQAWVSPSFDIDQAPAFFFLGAGVIAVSAVPITPASITTAVVAFAIGAYYLRDTLATVTQDSSRGRLTRVGYSEFALAGVLVFFLLLPVSFGSIHASDGQLVNLYVHVLGYCLGFIVPYITFRTMDPVQNLLLTDSA